MRLNIKYVTNNSHYPEINPKSQIINSKFTTVTL